MEQVATYLLIPLCAWVKKLPHVHLCSKPSPSYLGLKKKFGNHWQHISNQICVCLPPGSMVCCGIVLLTRPGNKKRTAKRDGMFHCCVCFCAQGGWAVLMLCFPEVCFPLVVHLREKKQSKWGCIDSHSSNKPDSYTVKPTNSPLCSQWKRAQN